MSWIQKLYETYNQNELQVGYSDNEAERPLLPICHTTAKVQIEIVLDIDGNFRRAKFVLDRNDTTTIIPCTEESAGRTSNVVAHPLCDKLQYVAGDLLDNRGNEPSSAFQEYIQILNGWCQSKFSHPKAQAVLRYIRKKSVIKDLVSEGLLFVDSEGRLLSKGEVELDPNTENIFSIIQGTQESAFVRWVVENPGDLEPRIWRDESLWESWINYYMGTLEEKSICYVTGKEVIIATKHPRYIRREGDSAKLISSNDTDGYTFRGRFTEGGQVCNIGLEVSHKAHYALTWLISRQGYRSGDLAVVAWTTSGVAIPQPCESSSDLFEMDDLESDQDISSTAQDFALRLSKKIRGFTVELGKTTDIEVIALDSATTGRLAVTYYRELTGSNYLERIEKWHRECAWLHDFGYDREKGIYYRFIGAPSPYDIAEAAYGKGIDDSLRKATISRILPCIVDDQPLPRNLVISAIRRATKRISLDELEWKKALSVACALFKKINNKEEYLMTLEENRMTRDYLYGRLLALADDLEEWAQSDAGEKRPTNATRLMQRFSERPFTTWRTIELALLPYKTHLGAKAGKIIRTMDDVMSAFEPNDFINDKPLSGEFLLGFHSQKEARRKKDFDKNMGDDNEDSLDQLKISEE